MINRQLTESIKKFMHKFPVIAIAEPLHSGKITLVKILFSGILEASYVLFQLQPYFNNPNKRIIKL